MMRALGSVWSFVRRWRRWFAALLGVCFVMMVVEMAITDYTPPPDGVGDVALLLVAGTIYLWIVLALSVLLPVAFVIEAARWWTRRTNGGAP